MIKLSMPGKKSADRKVENHYAFHYRFSQGHQKYLQYINARIKRDWKAHFHILLNLIVYNYN